MDIALAQVSASRWLLFNFQWLARSDALLFRLFPHSWRRRLFINQSFFEQWVGKDRTGGCASISTRPN
jgi:hypothetical protein